MHQELAGFRKLELAGEIEGAFGGLGESARRGWRASRIRTCEPPRPRGVARQIQIFGGAVEESVEG